MSESVFSFQARANQSFRQRLEAKDADLDRARRALRLEAAKLKEQRQRGEDALRELAAIRETFRGKGASKAAYTAILALHRAQRALGYTPGDPVYPGPTFKDAADRRFAK
ncbi:MAG: hypothetical protein ACFFBS_10410 [Promethearchaeota archaeon]